MVLHDRLSDRNLILASGSPRRRELMEQADLKFKVASGYSVDEIFPEDMPAHEVALYLAAKKSEAYPCDLGESDILITADTVVIVGREVIGKPKDRQEAKCMIEMLSGTMHQVVTGVVVRTATKTVAFDSVTKVWLRDVDEQEVDYYIDRYKPFDKAGAYGIQEWIGCAAIERIEGSFYNVMGLPIQRLYQELKKI